jgi:rhodanese-related sulfurtransferase
MPVVPEIHQSDFAALHADGLALTIDVREAREFRTGHVPGARNVPLSLLPLHLRELPKDQPVFVICQSGGRSAQAATLMRAVGIDARSVTGGTAE